MRNPTCSGPRHLFVVVTQAGVVFQGVAAAPAAGGAAARAGNRVRAVLLAAAQRRCMAATGNQGATCCAVALSQAHQRVQQLSQLRGDGGGVASSDLAGLQGRAAA